jgi:hypothetical protein
VFGTKLAKVIWLKTKGELVRINVLGAIANVKIRTVGIRKFVCRSLACLVYGYLFIT